MKRMVEYMATECRKDKIWLRRTKPHKRDYHVMLAVDNSSSMSDNHCMQLAFETIATLSNAFTYLEIGQFGLMSFGEKCNVLHGFCGGDEQFSSETGARILLRLNFKDERTKIAEAFKSFVNLFKNDFSIVFFYFRCLIWRLTYSIKIKRRPLSRQHQMYWYQNCS